MPKLTKADRLALDAALTEAIAGRNEGGIPIGAALITPDGTVVASGRNLRVQTGDPTAHAEMACIRNAGRRRDWHTLTMATTLSPCAMCTGCAVLHQIPRIIIGESESFQGREDWLKNEGIELIHAHDQHCIDLMQSFIASHPDLWNEDIGLPPSDASGECGSL